MRRKSKSVRSLADAIKRLPTPDVSNSDIRALVLKLILEIPNDCPDSGNASRSKIKLEALKLLADINKGESSDGLTHELLSILEED